jgi:hypothetical protein
MLLKKPLFVVMVGALLLTGALVLLLLPGGTASAQCGSQASSCKNCHEVQAQDPVNNDGTGWHQSHAFGDFCEFCHAGNVQATDKDAAHTGMVAPLADVQASCGSCHAQDLDARAKVYATALGVDYGKGGGGATGSGQPSGGAAPTAQPETSATSTSSTSSSVVVNEANVIDYSARYDQTKSGGLNVNWGDVIVGVLIVVVVVGGGSFVYWNERRLRGAVPARPAPKAVAVPVDISAYPPEVVALIPQIAQLNPKGLFALKRMLEDPEDASELLHSLSRLDPELVRRIRSLDRDARALLMGLAGD